MSEKLIYPVVINSQSKDGAYQVYIPDLDGYTKGIDFTDAMAKDRDYIGNIAVFGDRLMPPNTVLINRKQGEMVTLVDVDINQYQAILNQKTVEKKVRIPHFLNEQIKTAQMDLSSILIEALLKQL